MEDDELTRSEIDWLVLLARHGEDLIAPSGVERLVAKGYVERLGGPVLTEAGRRFLAALPDAIDKL